MSNVQIIIPMSGHGKRFQRADIQFKPLIKVGGKPIIAHIIDMFQMRLILYSSVTKIT